MPKNPNNKPPITGPINPEKELTRLITALPCMICSVSTKKGILACTDG